MSATVMTEAMVMKTSTTKLQQNSNLTTKLTSQIDVDFAKCDCCGLTEECTLAYIDRTRELYQGKWICGLCAEAVKDEMVRCERLITAEEALNKHINFCKKFSSSGPPLNPAVHLISAMRRILRKSLDSPKSMPSSPMKNGPRIKRAVHTRSESCFPTLSLVDDSSYRNLDEASD